ncbi:uncharacterized protein M421DRAFT_415086 [Didymella exigua CBS 183.55]|uniref:DUF3431 domain-containing protein n=1 Tax=Didymella exigua CBS 183.55 TaxID=1150837 RepID=A0A6A5S3W9_9PLEO|nr:uncharacterized protein M421DRAFT_415086 [Didymella exigua CBS 183.55]KAF1934038.1 hypothetical protein M421DRAFT_415086 [Didymella exigua CBS 183.55]
MSKRKAVPFLAVAASISILLFFLSGDTAHKAWEGLPQHIGLGEHIGNSYAHNASGVSQHEPDYANWNPRPDFRAGSALPAGHNYTSTLVIARTREEEMDWLKREIPDQPTAIYVVDDPSAELHPPKNKGHEVMVYLTYIIDHYDSLADVTMFMHAHQLAWHNDEILGNDAAKMISRLSRPRVWREGFVNMRCSWYPGCPDWMHPGETRKNNFKQEEVLLAKSWSELFPLDEIPQVLAQPCCAQFALSRERIQAKSHAQYVWYREWLFQTKIPDELSGRIWEYAWQFVFTGEAVFCPKEHICFCDQYGTCFGGEDEFSSWKSLKDELTDLEKNLRDWEEKERKIKQMEEENDVEKLKKLEKPELGKNQEFQRDIDRLRPIIDRLRDEAEERGKDPKNRAKEVGRDWHEGDGF